MSVILHSLTIYHKLNTGNITGKEMILRFSWCDNDIELNSGTFFCWYDFRYDTWWWNNDY